jgi:HK97 family phage major capsid protein
VSGATVAAPVAEGALKPESNPLWQEAEAKVEKFAHHAKATTEAITDFTDFMRVVSDELLRGSVHTETSQLLTGNGTPPNLLGLLNASGIITRARSTDSNLDALLKASTDLRVGSSFAEPTLCVLHPSNYETIRLSKEATTGAYLLGNPLSADVPKLGTATIHLTTRMPAGTALLMNPSEAVRCWVREGPTISTGTVGDDFVENKLTLVAEERLAQAVIRPTAIAKVTGLN